MRKLLTVATKQGWRIDQCKGHYKCYAPDGTTIITVALTASDNRAFLNARSDFRRAGLAV